MKSRQLWDLINFMSLTYLDLWSNESSRWNLAGKLPNFTGCQLLYTTLPLKERNRTLGHHGQQLPAPLHCKVSFVCCSVIVKGGCFCCLSPSCHWTISADWHFFPIIHPSLVNTGLLILKNTDVTVVRPVPQHYLFAGVQTSHIATSLSLSLL